MSGQISLKPGNFPKKDKNQAVIPFLDKIHGSKRCILRCNDGGKVLRSDLFRPEEELVLSVGMYTGDFPGE